MGSLHGEKVPKAVEGCSCCRYGTAVCLQRAERSLLVYESTESSVFAQYVHDYFTEEECAGIQWYLSGVVFVGVGSNGSESVDFGRFRCVRRL